MLRKESLMKKENKKYPMLNILDNKGHRIKHSHQRITKGFADCDTFNIGTYLSQLIPAMLKDFKENKHSYPVFYKEDGETMLPEEESCKNWNEILDRMIFLWNELDNELCSKKNPYEEEFMKAFEKYNETYGFLGEGLMSEEEKKKAENTSSVKVHFMNEVPEYKEIHDKYMKEQKKIEEYQVQCKDEAFDLMKQYFYDLWD